MLVNTIKKNKINLLKKKINKNTPVIIVKNFIKPNYCKKIIKYCETIAKNTPHRKLSKNRDFYSLDVLPNNVKTDRIFRTFVLGRQAQQKYKFINQIKEFQKEYILKLKKKKIFSKVQVMHYPIGGGFFAEHKHQRLPTNYGIILTLSKKGRDFKTGVTNFRFKNKKINIDNHDISAGDIILFRYDLYHSISPCDPKKNLSFNNKGRWTMIFPVYHKSF